LSKPASIPNIQYAAEIKNVKEIVLFGTANLEFWQNHLQAENLFPYSPNGLAEFMISATELTYMGAQFRELVFSFLVCEQADPGKPSGFFLVHAFNSSRLFALLERSMFQTPYYHGNVQVADQIPASFKLNDGQGSTLNAKMSGAVSCLRGEDEMWAGPIYLPRRMTKNPGGLFYAKLGGYAEIFPFSPSMDTLKFQASPQTPVLQWLIDSNFTGKEWHIRHNAEHSRSKTYMRTS
jgi:hypothetical protein